MLKLLSGVVSPSSLKLVIFDLDGTLVDSVQDLKAALDQMYEGLAQPCASLEQVQSWVGNGAQVLVKRALSYDQVVSESRQDQFEKAFELFMDAYRQRNGECSEPYAGARDLLSDLERAGIPVAIVTNKPAQFTLPLLEKLKLSVQLVLSGDSLPRKKPDPLPLTTCLEHFGCAANEAVMVGDSESDMLAARAAGVKSVAVSYGYNHGVPISVHNPDLLIDSLRELR